MDIENGTIRQLEYGFLFAFHSNYGHIFRRFDTTHKRDVHSCTVPQQEPRNAALRTDLRHCANFQPHPFSSFRGNSSRTNRHKHTYTDGKLNNPPIPWGWKTPTEVTFARSMLTTVELLTWLMTCWKCSTLLTRYVAVCTMGGTRGVAGTMQWLQSVWRCELTLVWRFNFAFGVLSDIVEWSFATGSYTRSLFFLQRISHR